MGNLLGGGNSGGVGNGLGGYGYGPSLQCCDPVVDIFSVFGAIAAIAAASLFLRQAVIDNMVMGPGRRKRSLNQEFVSLLDQGTGVINIQSVRIRLRAKGKVWDTVRIFLGWLPKPVSTMPC